MPHIDQSSALASFGLAPDGQHLPRITVVRPPAPVPDRARTTTWRGKGRQHFLDLATRVHELRDTGLPRITIAKDLDISLNIVDCLLKGKHWSQA